jgi:hypothetical protein
MGVAGHRSPVLQGTLGRLLSLVGCVGVGSLVAVVGVALGGGQVWWLAVPAAVLVGWLGVANPSECLPPESPDSQSSGRQNAP